MIENIFQITEKAKGNELQDIVFDLSRILEYDGLTLSVVGYSIVFLALVVLYFVVSNFSRLLQTKRHKQLQAQGRTDLEKKDLAIPGEVSAAISMALYLHFEEAHDIESTVLTINRAPRTYSPWSSKIYNMTKFPRN